MDEVKGDDRAAARATVEAAFRAGRIIEVDKDLRLGQIATAATRTELASIVRGLDPAADAREQAAVSAEQWQPIPPEPAPPEPTPWAPTTWAPAPAPAPAPQPQPPDQPSGTHAPPPDLGDPSTWQVPAPDQPDQPDQWGPQVVVGGTTIDLQRTGASVARTARRVVATFVALLMFAAVGLTVLVARSFDDVGIDGFGDLGGEPVDIQTPGGVAEVIDAVAAETGSTMVFEATFFEDYAIVYTPAEPGSQRQVGYRYDGELEEWTRGRSSYQPFDLGELDGRVVRRLLQRAQRTLVEDGTGGFAIVRSAAPLERGTRIWAYARNDEFGETGFLVATIDGKVLQTHPVT